MGPSRSIRSAAAEKSTTRCALLLFRVATIFPLSWLLSPARARYRRRPPRKSRPQVDSSGRAAPASRPRLVGPHTLEPSRPFVAGTLHRRTSSAVPPDLATRPALGRPRETSRGAPHLRRRYSRSHDATTPPHPASDDAQHGDSKRQCSLAPCRPAASAKGARGGSVRIARGGLLISAAAVAASSPRTAALRLDLGRSPAQRQELVRGHSQV